MKTILLSICVTLLINVSLFAQQIQNNNLNKSSQNIQLLDHWEDLTLTAGWNNQRFSEVWGFVQNNEEYAVIGSTMGTHIFRVTNTDELDSLFFIEGLYTGANVVHRDYHDYNGYLYAVCAEGNHGSQVINLNYLPDSIQVDTLQGLLKSHNIFIDSSNGKMYSSIPTFSYQITAFDTVQIVGAHSGGHDTYARNDTVFMNDETNGLKWINYNDTIGGGVGLVNSLQFYQDKGYNHAGWLNEKGDVYAFGDETVGTRIKVCDVSDLDNLSIVSIIDVPNYQNLIPHNLMIKGDLLYISYYEAGLQVFDISNPALPFRVGYYDTYPQVSIGDYAGAWGIYSFLPSGRLLVSDMQSGLYLLKLNSVLSVVDEEPLNIDIEINNSLVNEMLLVNSNEEKEYAMRIYDLQGKLVLDRAIKYGINEVNCTAFTKGVYIVQVYSKDAVVLNQKIVKG